MTIEYDVKTKEGFLLDMLQYYGEDTARRCMNEHGDCCYAPTHENTEGCAIARHLTSNAIDELMNIHSNPGVDSCVLSYCPDWMKALGEAFLADMQQYHDIKRYWNNDKGLSDEGQSNLKYIIQKYNLDTKKFTSFLT